MGMGILRALLWFRFRRIVLPAAGTLVLGWMTAAGAARAITPDTDVIMRVFPEIVFSLGLLIVLCMLLLNDTRQRTLTVGFPNHLRTLPLPTWLLATLETVFGMAVVGAYVLAVRIILKGVYAPVTAEGWIVGTGWHPVYWMCAVAWAYALLWSLGAIHVVLALGAAVMGLLAFFLADDAGAGIAMVVTLIGCGCAIASARLARRGALQPIRLSIVSLRGAKYRGKPFDGAYEAQAWLESCQAGNRFRGLFAFAFAICMVPAIYPWIHAGMPADRAAGVFGNVATVSIACLLGTALLYSMAYLAVRLRLGFVRGSYFDQTRPLRIDVWSMARLRALAASIAGPWLFVVALNAVDVWFSPGDTGTGVCAEMLGRVQAGWLAEASLFAALSGGLLLAVWIVCHFGAALLLAMAVTALATGFDGDTMAAWTWVVLAASTVLVLGTALHARRTVQALTRIAIAVLSLMAAVSLGAIAYGGVQTVGYTPDWLVRLSVAACLMAALPFYLTPVMLSWERTR